MVSLVILGGALLRLTGLSIHSLWYDEGITLYVAQASDLVGALRADRHPPLSFLAFRWWSSLGGEADAWVRLLPALASTLSLPLFYLLARRLLSVGPAILALTVFAISPFQIWHAQEARMYAFVEVGALLAFLGAGGTGGIALLSCSIGTFIALGCHYMGGLAAPAAIGCVLWLSWREGNGFWNRGTWPQIGALCLGAAVWIPWFAFALPAQLATTWGNQLRVSARDLAELPIRQVLVELDVLAPSLLLAGYATSAAISLAFVIACFVASRDRRHGAAGALLLFGIPVIMALLATVLLPPNFTPKYLMVAAPGTALVVGAGVALLRPRAASIGLGTVVLLGCLLVTWLHRQGNHREDFRSACQEVRSSWQAGDQVLVITGTPPGHSESTVMHYLRGDEELTRNVRSWESFQSDPWPGRRLHVVYRSAKYAEANLNAVRASRPLLEESPERFRIQWLLLGPAQ